jgi:hypothetical protein
LAQPNYKFEKRRRDLEKKAKKDEKKRRKTEAGQTNPPANSEGVNQEPQ